MRKFRFRAWDTEKNKMVKVDTIDFNNGNVNDVDFYNQEIHFGYSTVLMQYTGLKDKNGTEIYECDITTNELYRNEGAAFVVYYDNEEGMFRQRPFLFKNNGKKLVDNGLTLQMDSVTNKEVIGNIYEHPHLLKE